MRSLRPKLTANRATGLCFALPLVLYVLTAARTVQGGDTGEFGLIGIVGGVAHPPGYPLYSLILRLFGALPFGAPFFRVSLASAVCGAAAVAVLQRVLWRLTGSLFASVGAALLFAVSEEQWRLSGVPEVFTLNVLLAATALLVAHQLVQAESSERWWRAGVLGVVAGLGVSNHHSIVMCAPLFAWPLVSIARRESIKAVSLMLGPLVVGVVIGLSPYLLLPWFARTAGPDAFVWGRFDSLEGFLAHFFRREYGTFKLGRSGETGMLHPRAVLAFLGAVPSHLLYVSAFVAVVGVFRAATKRERWFWPVLLAFLLAGPLFISLFNLPLDPLGRATQARFYLLPEVLLTPFVAAGLLAIQQWNRRLAMTLVGAGFVGALIFVFPRVDWSKDTLIERVNVAVLRGAAPNAIIFGEGDTTYAATRWAQAVLHERPDVRFVFARLQFPWFLENLQRTVPEFTAESMKKHRLPATLIELSKSRPLYIRNEGVLGGLYSVVPVVREGLLERVVPAQTPEPAPEVLEQQLLDLWTIVGDQPLVSADAENGVVRFLLAIRWMDLAKQFADRGDVAAAERCRARSIFLMPPEGEDWLQASVGP
jgi:hypothetical protein